MRRKSREIALQFFFSHDFQDRPCDRDALEVEFTEFCNSFETCRKSLDYARRLVDGICTCQAEIDELISSRSHNWRVERMALVDRNILRIAAYEMEHVEDVPATVAINEALEIAKRYAEPDAVAFINGILDSMQKEKNSG
jgi:N utilization substance protein B